MRTIFEFDKNNDSIKAYELGDSKHVDHTIDIFLNKYCFTGYGREETYTSQYYDGQRSLYYGEHDEIFLQSLFDEEYFR